MPEKDLIEPIEPEKKTEANTQTVGTDGLVPAEGEEGSSSDMSEEGLVDPRLEKDESVVDEE